MKRICAVCDSKIARRSHPHDQHVHHRLLAGPFGRAAADGEADLLAQLGFAGRAAAGGVRGDAADLLEEGVAILLDRYALQRQLDPALETVAAVERERDG